MAPLKQVCFSSLTIIPKSYEFYLFADSFTKISISPFFILRDAKSGSSEVYLVVTMKSKNSIAEKWEENVG